MAVHLWVLPALLPHRFRLPLSPSVILSVALCVFLCVSLCFCVAPSVDFCHSLSASFLEEKMCQEMLDSLFLWEDQSPGFPVAEWNVGILLVRRSNVSLINYYG